MQRKKAGNFGLFPLHLLLSGGLIMAYMNTEKKVEQLYNQYYALRTRLSEVGLICQGSALERTYHRKTKGQPTEYGPYYSWTRKIDNKTITVALSRAQHRLLSKAIAHQRKLEELLRKMRAISEQIVLLQAPGVASRKKRKTGVL